MQAKPSRRRGTFLQRNVHASGRPGPCHRPLPRAERPPLRRRRPLRDVSSVSTIRRRNARPVKEPARRPSLREKKQGLHPSSSDHFPSQDLADVGWRTRTPALRLRFAHASGAPRRPYNRTSPRPHSSCVRLVATYLIVGVDRPCSGSGAAARVRLAKPSFRIFGIGLARPTVAELAPLTYNTPLSLTPTRCTPSHTNNTHQCGWGRTHHASSCPSGDTISMHERLHYLNA